MTKQERIGILGGTFDPPHLAHLEIVQNVLSSQLVDRVLMVPCFRHAFLKTPESFEHRLAMCRLLVAEIQAVAVSDVERELKTPGRTLELVEVLTKKFPGCALRLVVGGDIYLERKNWYRFDAIEQMAPPIYLGRKGVLEREQWLPSPMNVSSHEIRKRLEFGISTEGMLSESVLHYIVEHQLYGV